MQTPLRLAIACAVLSAALPVSLSAAASSADAAFETAAKAFIEDFLRLNPEAATSLGDHRFDHRLRDYSPAEEDGVFRAALHVPPGSRPCVLI